MWVDSGQIMPKQSSQSHNNLPYLQKDTFVCKRNRLDEIQITRKKERTDEVLIGFKRNLNLRKTQRIATNASIADRCPYSNLPDFDETNSFQLSKQAKKNTIFTFLKQR